MADSIKVRLAVDGETKFKQQMKDAANAVKTVDSRLKVASEDFKKHGDAQKYAQERGKILSEEIKRQTQIVQDLENHLQETTNEIGENSAAALKWEGELNRAKVKLSQMQTALDNNSRGLDETGKAFGMAEKAADAFGDELQNAGKIAENTKFSTTIQAVSTLASSFERAAASVTRYAKNAWGLVVDSSVWADDLATLSTQIGVPAEELQRWNIAAKLVDTDVDTITKAYARLVNPSSEVQQTLHRLGISTTKLVQTGTSTHTGANGETVTNARYHSAQKSANELFWDAVDALNGITDATLQEEAANTLFGKSYLEMIPLIRAGREEWEKAGESADILSEDQVNALTEFNDKLNTMNESIDTMKRTISADLAGNAGKIADAVTALTGAATDFFNSEAGKKALSDITNFLASAAQFAANNPATAISATVAAIATLEGIKIAPSLVSTLALLRTFGGSKGVKNAVDAASAAAGGGEAASAGGGVIKAGFKTVAKNAFGAALQATEVGVLLWAAEEATANMVDEIKNQGTLLGIGQRDENGALDIGGIKIGGKNPEPTTSLWEAFYSTFIKGDDTPTKDPMGVPLIELKQIEEQFGQVGTTAADAVKTGIEEEVDVVTGAAEKAGESTALGFAAGIQAQIASVQAAVARMMAVAAPAISAGGAGVTYNRNRYDNSRTLFIDQLTTAGSMDELQQILFNNDQYTQQAYGQ